MKHKQIIQEGEYKNNKQTQSWLFRSGIYLFLKNETTETYLTTKLTKNRRKHFKSKECHPTSLQSFLV